MEPKNKTVQWKIEAIRKHINAFEKVDSRYCRSSTNRQYLDPCLSVRKMYDIFKDNWQSIELENQLNNTNIPSEAVYRNVFCTEFNLGFYRPKKDQCIECVNYKNKSAEERAQVQDAYDMHIKSKDRAQMEKKRDRERMEKDKGFVTATFDLQSILQLPIGAASPFYYKRKLVLYNLTVYEGTQDGYCFMWSEVDGKRGSNEIGSILYKYLSHCHLTYRRSHFSLTAVVVKTEINM